VCTSWELKEAEIFPDCSACASGVVSKIIQTGSIRKSETVERGNCIQPKRWQ